MVSFTLSQAYTILRPGAYLVPLSRRGLQNLLEPLDTGATITEIDDIISSFEGLEDCTDVRIFSSINPYSLDAWVNSRKGLPNNILLEREDGHLVLLDDVGIWDGVQSLSILFLNHLLVPERISKNFWRTFAH